MRTKTRWSRSEPRAQTSFHFWGIPLDPTPHRDVIGVQTSLGEQLLDVPVRQGKTQIPTNRQKDDFRFELPPLEQTGNRRRKEHWRSISEHSCKVATLPRGTLGGAFQILPFLKNCVRARKHTYNFCAATTRAGMGSSKCPLCSYGPALL